MKYDVLIDGTPLNTSGTGVTKLTGLGGVTGRDFYNTSTFARDGETSIIGGFTASTFGVEVLIDGRDRGTGLVPSGSTPEAEAWANLQWLSGLFASDYLLNVEIVMPAKAGQAELITTLTCQAQLLTMATPRWSEERDYCVVLLGFKNPSTYFRPAGGGDLDSLGWKTINVAAGVTALTLPTDVHHMNGFIEDAQFLITNSTNAIKTVSIKSLNRGSGTANPELIFTSTRTNGVVYASKTLAIDCKAHTAIHDTTESVIKYADWKGGRPGTMLRIGPPYQLQLAFTPYVNLASMAGVTWQIKYRPSYI